MTEEVYENMTEDEKTMWDYLMESLKSAHGIEVTDRLSASFKLRHLRNLVHSVLGATSPLYTLEFLFALDLEDIEACNEIFERVLLDLEQLLLLLENE